MATWPIHQKAIFFSFLFMMRFGIEGGVASLPERQKMKLPINWPWHRVCTGGALSMRSVSFVLHERERNEEVVVASPAKRRMRIKV